MIQRDFWRNSDVAVIGSGAWGTVLSHLISRNSRQVWMWTRDEDVARTINTQRTNLRYFPGLHLSENIYASVNWERVFEGDVQVVIWALPSSATRSNAKVMAKYLKGHEIIIHATKGIETDTSALGIRRISEVLAEELPCRRIGVISGPNLAKELAQGQPAAAVVASHFSEVCEAGQALFSSEQFRIYRESDVSGVEWAGVLKNIFAIAAGAVDGMNLGWNTRAMLMTRGLAEMVRFGDLVGARAETFLGLAGVGDLIATCCSPLSRNYQVGQKLALGHNLKQIAIELNGVAEGVRTTAAVWKLASNQKISMPITEAVHDLLAERIPAVKILQNLMRRPLNY